MVNLGGAARWAKRLLAPLRGDERRRLPGLLTYELRRSGGRRRLHLRFNPTGDAVLLIDVTDAVHLNRSAALLVRLALEGTPVDRVAAALKRKFRGVNAAEARAAAESIYAMVDRLADPASSCPTCSLAAGRTGTALGVKWSPPFSSPVSAPYKADLALTYACNNRCPHCYKPASPGEANQTPL